MSYISVDGKILLAENAKISPFDHGLMYGIGLFETFRTYDGVPFLLHEHLERMNNGCQALGIAFTYQIEEVKRHLTELLEVNGWRDGYFRFTVTAGIGELGLPNGDYDRPTIIIYTRELETPHALTERSCRSIQLLRLRRNTPEGQLRFKSLHFMNNVLGKRELMSYSWAAGAEGLFLDSLGRLAEGLVSNLFFVRGDRLCTPSLETGILPGITRAKVMELAKTMGVPVEEGFYTWSDLLQSQEVFLTNSIQEVVPVTALFDRLGEKHRVQSGAIGHYTAKLFQAYRKETKRMTPGRMKD